MKKHYYFMRKPEVLEVQEYKTGEYIQYYNREPDPNRPVVDSEVTLTKRRRRWIYFLDIVLVLAMFLYYRQVIREVPDSLVHEEIRYFLEWNEENRASVHLQNQSQKVKSLSKTLEVNFLAKDENQTVVLQKKEILVIEKELQPEERYFLASVLIPKSRKNQESEETQQLEVRINDDIVLQKKKKITR